MKVKIVKANRPTYWYATEIGKLFDVVEDGTYYVVNDDSSCCIDWMDAIEVDVTRYAIAIDLRGVTRTTKEKVCKKLFDLGVSYANYDSNHTVTMTPDYIMDSIGVLYVTDEFRPEGQFGIEYNGETTNCFGRNILSVTDVLSGRSDDLIRETIGASKKPLETPKKVVNCKIDLGWCKGLAREVISEAIQKKLFECGAAWNIMGAELEKDVCCYLFVVNNIITTTGEKKKFDGLQDGNWCTKEQLAQIPEVSVNNALAGKFWTYSSVPKKEEVIPLYYKVNLSSYKGKERELISKAIQEEAFKKGFRWGMYGETYRHTDMPRLVFWTQDNTICYGSTPDDPWMNDKEDKILTVEEILSGALPNVKK